MGALDRATLEQLAGEAGLASPSIVLRRLGEPALEVTLEPGRRLYPASMIKVPLAAAVYALGPPLDAKVAVRPENVTANDAASPLVPGYEATIDELATLMIARSDNVATNVLIDVVGRREATDYVQWIGLSETVVARKLSGSLPLIDDPEATGRNAHPAADSAALFEMIALCKLACADWLFEKLRAQEWNEKLPRGLLPGDRFAHKTGDTDEVTHDGGILELPNGARYVLVVYTSFPTAAENDVRFGSFMMSLRPFL